MEYVLRSLKRFGIDEVIITTHYQAASITEYFGNGDNVEMRISYSHETELMDTAGSLALLKGRLAERVLICSGHYILPTLDILDVLKFHAQNNADGTVVFKELEDENNLRFFGQGQLDQNSRLVLFKEKPESTISPFIHTTYQVYNRRILETIPSDRALSIPEYLIPRMLADQDRIFGYVTRSEMLNISNPDRYNDAIAKANRGVLDGG